MAVTKKARQDNGQKPAAGGPRPDTSGDVDRANGAGAAETPPGGNGATDPGAGADPADLSVGGMDACDRKIAAVFFKRALYAIYLADERVRIQFARDRPTATEQINRVSPLLVLRDRMEDLARQLGAPRDYDHQIANAMRMGLEDKAEVGEALLEAACDRASAELKRRGRMQYLRSAGTLAVVVAAALLALGTTLLLWSVNQLVPLAFSMAGGALGALLSIAIAIQKRTVAPAGDPLTNRVDGQLRVIIAVLSAGTLSLLASTGFIDGFAVGGGDAAQNGARLGGADMVWQVPILIGLAAGFVERLVPDLLDKASVTPAAASRTNDP